jgi:hypothetical protein
MFGGCGMAERERLVITVQETLSADVIKEKGIAVRLLGTDDIEYLVQLAFDEAHALTDVITIALATAEHSTHKHN